LLTHLRHNHSLFCVAIVLTDISVKNATSDFSDGTSSFADVRSPPPLRPPGF
jgi:hypothetical protein